MSVIALAGQPNVGKSSVFNSLTKFRQHVGNWPGKTVDKKEGAFALPDGRQVSVIDLPGTYSMTSHTIEEIITRDFIVHDKPDLIINMVDASNLERNLYLTTELLELGRPVIIVLNMMDMAEQRGYSIDFEALARELDVPVLPMVATRKIGIDELSRSIQRLIDDNADIGGLKQELRFSDPVEEVIREIADRLGEYHFEDYSLRWLAIKLLEDDRQARQMIAAAVSSADIAVIDDLLGRLPDCDARLAEDRYRWINKVLNNSVNRSRLSEVSPSDRIDRVLTDRWLGIPILLAALAATFFLVFKIAPPLQAAIVNVFTWVSRLVVANLGSVLPGWMVRLTTDGILAGVGTAISFVPLIFLVFAAFGVLEDVGYFARGAFVMDRFLGRFGIPGKAFISLLMGYSCSVPGIMAARTAESERDRLLIIMLTPLTICSARQVVAIALIGAFFTPLAAPWVMLGLYLGAFALICLVSVILSKTVLKAEGDQTNTFFIELPKYRWPNWANIMTYSWNKTRYYVKRAATYIAAVSALFWVLSNFPGGSIDHSVLGTLGRLMAPLGKPFGFDWRLMVALLSGFAAKETTLATLGVLYHVSGANLVSTLGASVPFAAGLSFFVFSMFYIPCLVTTVTVRRETGSWKWTLFSAAYALLLASVLSFVAYNLALVLA